MTNTYWALKRAEFESECVQRGHAVGRNANGQYKSQTTELLWKNRRAELESAPYDNRIKSPGGAHR